MLESGLGVVLLSDGDDVDEVVEVLVADPRRIQASMAVVFVVERWLAVDVGEEAVKGSKAIVLKLDVVLGRVLRTTPSAMYSARCRRQRGRRCLELFTG